MRLKANKWTNYYQSEYLNSRLTIYLTYPKSKGHSFREDVLAGLSGSPKYLHPKYFYDKRGSELFEKICSTGEYYVTRTETEILRKYSDDVICRAGTANELVELGSGASVKTRSLINAFLNKNSSLHYLPIDVSPILFESSNQLVQDFPSLKISGIISEYEGGVSLVNYISSEPKLYIFLGSSIGNFDKREGKEFIKYIADNMTANDHLLVGFDMVKDRQVLHNAYNDSEGITAEFNLNLLNRINSELGGQFDNGRFGHQAFFNENESRVEMHLVSKEKQDVIINDSGEIAHFEKGESIHTENSYKFTGETINSFADHAGLKLTHTWTDGNNYFSLCLFSLR